MASVRKIRNQHIKNITQANQNKCGSGENGIARLEDGTTVCVRYGMKYFLIFGKSTIETVNIQRFINNNISCVGFGILFYFILYFEIKCSSHRQIVFSIWMVYNQYFKY